MNRWAIICFSVAGCVLALPAVGQGRDALQATAMAYLDEAMVAARAQSATPHWAEVIWLMDIG